MAEPRKQSRLVHGIGKKKKKKNFHPLNQLNTKQFLTKRVNLANVPWRRLNKSGWLADHIPKSKEAPPDRGATMQLGQGPPHRQGRMPYTPHTRSFRLLYCRTIQTQSSFFFLVKARLYKNATLSKMPGGQARSDTAAAERRHCVQWDRNRREKFLYSSVKENERKNS